MNINGLSVASRKLHNHTETQLFLSLTLSVMTRFNLSCLVLSIILIYLKHLLALVFGNHWVRLMTAEPDVDTKMIVAQTMNPNTHTVVLPGTTPGSA